MTPTAVIQLSHTQHRHNIGLTSCHRPNVVPASGRYCLKTRILLRCTVASGAGCQKHPVGRKTSTPGKQQGTWWDLKLTVPPFESMGYALPCKHCWTLFIGTQCFFCGIWPCETVTASLSHKALSAYISSEQILHFDCRTALVYTRHSRMHVAWGYCMTLFYLFLWYCIG